MSLIFCGTTFLAAGCTSVQPPDPNFADPVLVSVINVTEFEVSVTLSGVLAGVSDTVRQQVSPIDSFEVTFECVEEVVVGDPTDLAQPGVVITAAEGDSAFDPFAIRLGESYACGDIIDIIVSGVDEDSFAVDAFVLTPP